MKKKLLAILCVICAIACTGFFASCLGGGDEPPTLELEWISNDDIVVYGEEINYDNFVLKADGDVVPVTSAMVSGWDTSSVGVKVLTITYGDVEASAVYVVKYQVKLLVDGEVISTQYVLNASGISVPAGYVFDIPSQITGNLSLNGSEEITSTEVTITVGDSANELPVGASGVTLPVTVTGTSVWNVNASNDNITARKMSGMVLITANKVGVTELTVTAGDQTVTKTIVIKPESLTITQSAKNYGIENLYTIGRTNVNGAVTKTVLGLFGGKGWIRTTEDAVVRFTV